MLGVWAYLLLFIIGLIVLCLSYWKIRSFRIFILYFTVTGVTLFFDYIIYVWGKAYIYKPHFLEGRYDTHLGAIVNGHLLSSFAVAFVILRCKWYVSIPMALLFTLVELIFTHWGIFESFWWSPWYTIIGLIIYFPTARAWWGNLRNKWIHFGTLLLSFYAIFIPSNILLYAIIKTRTFHIEWIEHLHRHSSAFNSFTGILFGLILAYVSLAQKRKLLFPYIAFGFIGYDFLLKLISVVISNNNMLDSMLSFLIFCICSLFVRFADSKITHFNDS